jgi:nitroimidazol reductase NimA-like FMN-containing flavoprotein (pyridoxamine 5'-phosphate oxidase superfamily)
MTTGVTVSGRIEELSPADCWTLLRGTGLGRLATAVDGFADIFPVNYFVHEESILFRTAPGSKLVNIALNPGVAFEVDGVDTRWHWSVVIHGTAQHLLSEADVIESGVMELVSWSPTAKHNYVRITPDDVNGRRIDRHSFPRASLWG